MDAFAVSVCKGLSVKKLKAKHMLTVGVYFGGFQALMPLLGYILGIPVSYTHLVLSVSTMGICGELAERKSEGLGSFRIALLDALSLLSDDDYTRLLKLREV